MSDSVRVGAAVPFRFILSNISAFIFNSSSRKIVTNCEQDNISDIKWIDRQLVFLMDVSLGIFVLTAQGPILKLLGNDAQMVTYGEDDLLPLNHQDHSNLVEYHTSDIPSTQSPLCWNDSRRVYQLTSHRKSPAGKNTARWKKPSTYKTFAGRGRYVTQQYFESF